MPMYLVLCAEVCQPVSLRTRPNMMQLRYWTLCARLVSRQRLLYIVLGYNLLGPTWTKLQKLNWQGSLHPHTSLALQV
jgi:hypothetical protein